MSERRGLRRWRWPRVVIEAAVLVALGVFWINFAPTHLGGDSTYVVTSGISMEPLFHTGDLAILRPASSYHVGEIVGYMSPRIGIVLHRIIGVTGHRFLMKGDNNNFVDGYHPTPSDVVGRLWLHIPKVGRFADNPATRRTTVVVAAAAMAGMVGVPVERERRRRRRNAQRGDAPANGVGRPGPTARALEPRSVTGVLGLPGQVAASVIAVVALAALVLGVFSFTRSTNQVATTHLSYRQVGTWSYSAAATGDVYSHGVATSGQPIYPSVAPVMKVTFAYRLASALPAHVIGRASLTAQLTGSDGWSHVLPIDSTATFSGTRVTLNGTLNLSAIERYLVSVETQTGQITGHVTGIVGAYALTLTPTVHISGAIGGASLRAQKFSPSLPFTIQGKEVQLNTGLGSAAIPAAQLLRPSKPGSINVATISPATLSFLGLHPSVAASRDAAEWTLLACLIALLGLGWLLRRAYRAPETDRILARYGSLLVAVDRPETLEDAQCVRVATIDDLARFAIHQGRMIMHCNAASGRDYFVRDQSLTYLFSVRDHVHDEAPAHVTPLAGVREAHSNQAVAAQREGD